jgi:hypothetical protein
MSWMLLATPIIGIIALIAILWIGHVLLPPTRTSAFQAEFSPVDYNALVQKTALILGKGIIAIMRDSLDKLTPVRAPAAQDMSSEFPQFAKPTSMSFEGSLELDLGNVAQATEPNEERAKVARRTIGPRPST